MTYAEYCDVMLYYSRGQIAYPELCDIIHGKVNLKTLLAERMVIL